MVALAAPNACTEPSVEVVWRSVAGKQRQRGLQLRVVGRDGREVGVRGADQRRELALDAAQRVGDEVEVVDGAADVALARGQQSGERLGVAVQRLEALERAAQVGHRAGARMLAAGAGVMEGLGATGEQQHQVVARVGVQRGQDLREVDVGLGVGGRERPAVGHPAGAAGAGIQGQVHVLERRAGPQQHRRVAVDRRVLLVDVHRHDGLAVVQRHPADLADLDAGDRHRLALAGGDRRRGGERRPHRVVRLAEHERRLVAEDVGADADGGGDEHRDGGEVEAVLADGALHGPAPVLAALRLGGAFLKHGTLAFRGGVAPG